MSGSSAIFVDESDVLSHVDGCGNGPRPVL